MISQNGFPVFVSQPSALLCGECKKTATHGVQDLFEVTISDLSRGFFPHGEPRHGCDEHPVTQRMYNVHGVLIK